MYAAINQEAAKQASDGGVTVIACGIPPENLLEPAIRRCLPRIPGFYCLFAHFQQNHLPPLIASRYRIVPIEKIERTI
jgi:hypothetical protein